MTDTPTSLEAALARAGQRPRFLAGDASTVDPARAAANLATIQLELDGARPPRLARVLRRVGVPDRTVPLITATPGLRRSWRLAVTVALLFALNLASTSVAEGPDRIVGFLVLAPLVPLLGVALSFGPGVDPTHDTTVAAPIDGFRLFLLRAVTVLAASTGLLLVAALLVPTGGAYRIAWLLPALALTAITLAAATRVDARRAAVVVAVGWVLVMTVATNRADAAAVFGIGPQMAAAALAVLAAVVFTRDRRLLDHRIADR